MYSRCHRIWYDSEGKTWWIWDGKRFKQAAIETVKYICIHQLSTVYGRLRAELKEQIDETVDENEKKLLSKRLDKVRRYYDAGEIGSTLTIMAGEMALDLVGELDANPDILNVQNGVINLRTGQLDIHRPEYLCTKLADVNFKGLSHPTPTIRNFLDDIFNGDQALIEFMRRLWGYAINGRISEEIIVFLLGSGGNGKGVCKEMLENTLGEYYGVMAKDAVVKPPGQRPPTKGAATGYLAELKGFRVAITDETSPGERVDLGLVLMMTGGGKQSFRNLFEKNATIRFTHTPFIQTNYDPEIPPTLAKQANIDRRLIVVRFPNEYVSENKFDETNPSHRLVDGSLKQRMQTPAVCEEFLTFLIQGSCAWYEDPTVLRRHPPAVQAASMAWLQRGDKLQTFLQSEHCVLDAADTPEAAKTVTWEDEFWRQFQLFAGLKIAKEELARQMREKGYGRTKRAGRFTGDLASQRSSCYVGFKCEYD
ncbi:hypothetical protein KFL_001520090 [Klebsormidium nitens]|uniref:SF3 helicase domain-containing protein n=1 Tax=Klebsormidium nitens TaxID=105231 RepID=A0A1Y1I276_KLENI|nr:hypothetical protein KFL_001520090 [Klebsormidium nitens]|eukprot:GAQ83539.1 hypothetical protein KFL_001520090 [Klebsormidium nitens]